MGKAGARIGFICMTGAHLAKRNGAPVDQLTVHEKEWAYCPWNARLDGHEWKPTGGVTMSEIESVVRGMRERAGSDTRARKR